MLPHPQLGKLMVRARLHDLQGEAARETRGRLALAARDAADPAELIITIRPAWPDDAVALSRRWRGLLRLARSS